MNLLSYVDPVECIDCGPCVPVGPVSAIFALDDLTQSKYALAEPLFTEALEVQRRVLGKEHPDTLHTMNSMAELYRDQGRYAQAEPIFARVLDLRSRVLGEEHPNTLDTLEELAQLDEDLGKYAQAEPLYVRVLALRLRVLGQNHPDTASVLASLGRLRLKQQRFAEAEALFRTALNSLETATPDAWARYHTQSLLGVSLAAQKKYTEAEAPLLSGYAGMLQRRATIPTSSRRQLDQAGESIVKFFKDWGKPDEAERWTQNLRAAKLSVARDDP